MSESPTDRRGAHRRALATAVILRTGEQPERVHTLDVSATGGFVVTQRPRPAGQVVHLLFRVPGADDWRVEVRALVVRVVGLGAREPGMGVLWLEARCNAGVAPLCAFLRDVAGLGPSALHEIRGSRYLFAAAERLQGALRAPAPVAAVSSAVLTPDHAPTETIGFRDSLAFGARRLSRSRSSRARMRRASAIRKLDQREESRPIGGSRRTPPPESAAAAASARALQAELASLQAQLARPRGNTAAAEAPLPAPDRLPVVDPAAAAARPAPVASAVPQPPQPPAAPPPQSERSLLRKLTSITGRLLERRNQDLQQGVGAVSPNGRFYAPGQGAIPDDAEPLPRERLRKTTP